jgi:hypothetical protein
MAEDQKKSWIRKIIGGDVMAVILGSIFGAKLAEGHLKTEVLKKAGEELRKNLTPNREEVMKELLILGENGDAIVNLLKEANAQKFIQCGSKRYMENWIINMLLKIKPEDRQWGYALLNEICERSREEFFTFLEILCNDGIMQWATIAKESVKDWLKATGIDLSELNKKAKKFAEKIDPKKIQNPSRFGKLAKRLIR